MKSSTSKSTRNLRKAAERDVRRANQETMQDEQKQALLRNKHVSCVSWSSGTVYPAEVVARKLEAMKENK